MRLTVLIISAAAVAFGLLWRFPDCVVAGAVLHLACGVVGVSALYRDIKRHGRDEPPPKTDDSTSMHIVDWLNSAISLTGLVVLVVTSDTETNGYSIAGGIIWFGTIASYFISGIIIREVGGVPLSMEHGGWKVRRDRNGNFR